MNWLVAILVFGSIVGVMLWLWIIFKISTIMDRHSNVEVGAFFFVAIGIGIPISLFAGWLVTVAP